MRKLFYLGFCLVLAMGIGCALTNYELITDASTGEIINTNGKAIIQGAPPVYTDDGTTQWFLFWMVDQKANGDRTLSTYSYTTASGENPSRDFFYCSPDWTGCAIVTANDPEDPADDPYDAKINVNCPGIEGLVYLFDDYRYYGECGRAAMPVQDRLAFLAAGNLIDEFTLAYNMNAGNTSVILDNNAGVRSLVPLLGSIGLELNTFKGKRAFLDVSNPLLANTFRWMADWNDTFGTGHTEMTFIFNGIVRTSNIDLYSDGLNARANQL